MGDRGYFVHSFSKNLGLSFSRVPGLPVYCVHLRDIVVSFSTVLLLSKFSPPDHHEKSGER